MGSSDLKPGPFDVKIIGAGIAGLAAGLALVGKGHRVTIYESKPELSEFGAGLQLQPNGTRIVYQWGLQDAFLKLANEPDVGKVLRYATGAVIGELPHNPQTTWEYGYPHWQVYRPDFQMILATAAQAAGVKIKLNHKVTGMDVENGEITFHDGSKVQGDLIVGADGILSRTRECIPANVGAKAVAFKEYCFRTVVPKAKMNSDPETAELMRGQDSMIWCGPGVTVLGYTVSGGELYNTLTACPRPSEAPLGHWNEPGDVEEARDLVKDFCPAVKKIWSYVDSCAKWTLGEVPRIDRYASQSGKFVLIGDAAHALVPHLGQGGGMALEDCAALAEFVSWAQESGNLAQAMSAFQEFRQPRIETLRQIAYGNQAFMSLEDGPEQQERDKLWGMMTRQWKEEVRQLGEEGIKAKPRPEAIPGKDMRSPESRQYLSGYDVFEEAVKFIEARKQRQVAM